MPKEIGAELYATWGSGAEDDGVGEIEVQLVISKRNWSKILRGDTISLRGRGYSYEGDFFWDYWRFSGGLDGEVTIECVSPKKDDLSDGECYSAKLKHILANSKIGGAKDQPQPAS